MCGAAAIMTAPARKPSPPRIIVGRRPKNLFVQDARNAPGMPARNSTDTNSDRIGSSYLQ
jgi:hypothetical protein